MSNASSGSGVLSGGDLNVGIDSIVVSLDNAANAGAGLLSTLIAGTAYTGMTVFNRSATNTLRVTVIFTGQAAIGGDTNFLVPPGATYSATFDGDAITGFSSQFVALPVVAGSVNGNALAAATISGLHQAVIDLVNQ